MSLTFLVYIFWIMKCACGGTELSWYATMLILFGVKINLEESYLV